MGTYLNPGNSGFARIVKSDYVDKTGLIAMVNQTIGTTRNLTCISRPRRFGKSYAAQMLCAYYDKSCDSDELFESYEIAEDPSYNAHRNQYDVIYLDMAQVMGEAGKIHFIDFIKEKVTEEIKAAYPDIETDSAFSTTLVNTVEKNGNQFVAIIDEWDAPIREAHSMEKPYLEFLRMLFKGSGTTAKIFAAAYMTGILPIKKDGSQSAISDFKEYSVLAPGRFAEYAGFTEEEVRRICVEKDLNYGSMKKWYDGYTIGGMHSIYNPYSVMHAVDSRRFGSFWKKTSAAETLITYIDMDQDGLQDDIARLIAGERIEIVPDSFQNDVETFTCKDDVLTLLVHLGYLTYEEVPDTYDGKDSYDEESEVAGLVRIPNEEVRSEFKLILRKSSHKSLIALVRKSDQLLKDTLDGKEDAVARAIEEVRESEYAPTFYNNEQSLRYVVKIAYISCVDQYAKVEELPSGHGLADVVFLPKRRSNLPAMVIELKWNHTASGAIRQIKDKKYPKVLEKYGGDIVLVGLSYDGNAKMHECRIERCTNAG